MVKHINLDVCEELQDLSGEILFDLEKLNEFYLEEKYDLIRQYLSNNGREFIDDNEYFFRFKINNKLCSIGFQRSRVLFNMNDKQSNFVYFRKGLLR